MKRLVLSILVATLPFSAALAEEEVDYDPFGMAERKPSAAPAQAEPSATPSPSPEPADTTTAESATAAPPAPAPETSPSPAPENPDPLSQLEEDMQNTERDPASLLKLQASLAELAYEKDKNLENLGAFVLAQEKLLQQSCMPQLLQTLQHVGVDPANKECAANLERTFDLDSASPVAFCARDGIDSENCRNAMKNQTVGTYGPSFDPQRNLDDPRGGGTAATRDAVKALHGELVKSKRALSGSSGAERQHRSRIVEDLYNRLLILNCAVVRLQLSPIQRAQIGGSSSTKPKDDSLEAAIAALAEDKKVKKNRSVFDDTEGAEMEPEQDYGPPHSRRRLLPGACSFYISDALKFDPKLPAAICHREGFVTPACINALREYRVAAQAREAALRAAAQATRAAQGLPTVPPRGAGFSTF